ncbi:hypothetical protein Tco_0123195 [Tanacetum coccineum]
MNDKETDSEEVDVRPTGRDKAKNKGASSSFCLESSAACAHAPIDQLVHKWTNVASGLFSNSKESLDHDKLRIVVFPISLAGGARRWFDRTKESITCWVDLTANFFRKYYPPSRIEGNNTPVIKWDPTNPRFEGWLAKKFVNYKTMDIFTKGALWDYWKIGGDEIEVSDDESSDLEEY